MGLMSGLEKLAAGPLGQTLGGFLEGEIQENQIEKQIEMEKDRAKAGLVDFASKEVISQYTNLIGTSNKKYDAIESLKDQGIPMYFISEMDKSGMFEQDNPYNALGTAQELWGPMFWRDEKNPYFKQYTKISGAYELDNMPDIANKYKSKSKFAMSQINNILENGLNMGPETVNFLTNQNQVSSAPGTTTTTGTGTGTGATTGETQTSDSSIPSLSLVTPTEGADVEETQMRMAINPDYLVRLGFEVSQDDFTADGEFNWAAFQAKNPTSLAAVTLLRNNIASPYAMLANGTADNNGLAINGVKDNAEKELIINALKKNNDIPYTTENAIRLLDRANPNWLQTYKNLGMDTDVGGTKNVVGSNPFAGTPFEYLITENDNGLLSFMNKPNITEDDYKNYADNILTNTMFNPREPLTYFDVRDIHSKYYGNQATLTVESGAMVKPDPVFGGTGRQEIATSMGGPTAEDMMFSEKYIVPSTVKFKKEKTNVEYTPTKGMSETTSVLLGGTSMGTVAQIESTLEDFADDIVGLEGFVTNLLLEQQQAGLLPKALTVTDMETLKDTILDDIFEMEYEVKTDKVEVDSKVDNQEIVAETENEVIPNVEDNIITEDITTEDFPVDTKVSTTKTKEQLELDKKQKERKEKIDNIVNNASTVVENAQQFLEDNKAKDRDELEKIGKEREQKVINFFKSLIGQ
jgi:hypothetical protein